MVDNIKIAVLGGDRRQIYALSELAHGDRRIAAFGIPNECVAPICSKNIEYTDSMEDALRGAKVVLLPFPASSDGVRINCPLDVRSDREGDGETKTVLKNEKLSSLERYAERDALIIGGKLPLPFVLSARQNGFSVIDMLEFESFEMKNAYISAEAATSVAMNSLSKTVCTSRIAVTGFGRISKHLCRLLSMLGAEVTTCARRQSDLAFAQTLGYETVMIKGERWCDVLADGYDVIFNTVPDRIFDSTFLSSVNKKTLMVELASAPGGFDIGAAQEYGANLSWALSLPGKYAPESAGKLIAECVEAILAGGGEAI